METKLVALSQPNVEFDEDNHFYFVNGVHYPSVTQVIADAGLYGNTSYFTDYHRDRGSFVHKIIQYHLEGELDEDTIDLALQGYFEAWKRFETESSYVPESCETIKVNELHRYAGTIDHIGHMNGNYCLIDVKTSLIYPATAIQTGGYAMLMKSHGVKRFGLQLTQEGKYKLTEFKDWHDSNVFLSALSLYYWKKNYLKGA